MHVRSRLKKWGWRLERRLWPARIRSSHGTFRKYGIPRGVRSIQAELLGETGTPCEWHFPEVKIQSAPMDYATMPARSISYDRLRFYGVAGGICRRDEICLSDDGYLIEELMRWTHAELHPSLQKPFVDDVTPYAGRVLALNIASHQNYYHWTVDCLMAVHGCRKAGIKFDALYFESGKPFQKESLGLLGWDGYTVIDAAESAAIQAKCLIVHNNKVPHPPTPATLEFLRQEYIPRVLGSIAVESPGRKIYFSRRKVRGRNLINEEEIIALLQSNGFEILLPEEMSLVEQARTAYSASAICGVHGAAFTNLIFARPGTKVIELVSPQYPDETYRRLAYHFDLDYCPFWAGGENTPTPDYWTNNRAPLEVPVESLGKFLRERCW